MTIPSLLSQHCKPLKGVTPMTEAQFLDCLAAHPELQGWCWVGNSIERSATFKNFYHTMAFANALAFVCHREDHHPTLTLSYGACVIRLDTHSIGGVSMNDLICAAHINQLLAS